MITPPPLLAVSRLGPEFWVFVIPLILGMLAIFLLLPKPRAFPALFGILLGLAALITAGFLLVPARPTTPNGYAQTILFYTFSAIAIIAGGVLVTHHNPARAALSFALVVLSTCGLFLLLAAPFLMAATIIIYAGAIVVTFLFVLMLAQQEGISNADARSREPLLASIAGFALLGTLVYLLQLSYGTASGNPALRDIDNLLERTREAQAQNDAAKIDELVGKNNNQEELFQVYKDLLQANGLTDLRNAVEKDVQHYHEFDFNQATLEQKKEALEQLERIGSQARRHLVDELAYLQPYGNTPLSNLSGPPATVGAEELRRTAQGDVAMPRDNAAFLGKSLFTDFLLPVELGGTLLLVATVGAIAIAYRRLPGERTP